MIKSNLFIKTHSRAISLSFAFFALLLFFFYGGSLFAGPLTANVYNGTSADPTTATWGPNFGWVSLNSCNNSPDGPCNAPGFGVNLDVNSGLLTGQGWSNNLGWISFDSGYTAVCGSEAKLVSNDLTQSSISFKGWARAIVAPSTNNPNDYWNGCISLSELNPNAGSGYGVKYQPATGDIVGSAWGSNNIGWLNFAAHTIINPDQPFIQFYANPAQIQPGQSTYLEWNTIDIQSCTPVPNTDDPTWNSATISIPMQSPWQTGSLTQSNTYEMDCVTPDGQNVSASATVSVVGEPIILTAPVLASQVVGSNPVSYASTLSWSSAQNFSSCQVQQFDNNGNIILAGGFGIGPIQSTSYGPVPVPVPFNPTTYIIHCNSPAPGADSNSVTIWQDQPMPVLQLSAGCAATPADAGWIQWNIEDYNLNTCTMNGGALYQSNATVSAPIGSYTLSCTNPITNQTDSTTATVTVGTGSCLVPVGTIDPDIVIIEI